MATLKQYVLPSKSKFSYYFDRQRNIAVEIVKAAQVMVNKSARLEHLKKNKVGYI